MSTRPTVRTILNFPGFSLFCMRSRSLYFLHLLVRFIHFSIDSKNNSGYTLSGSTANASTTGRAATTTTTTKKSASTPTSRDEDLRQVRLKQQEIADERARLAAILRTQKQQAERERKNHVALEKKKQEGGDVLGGESTSEKTYNPLQPLAASSTGYR